MGDIQKGSIVMWDGWWFVVVEVQDGWLHAICDNANNRYSFKIEEADYIASWQEGDKKLMALIRTRSVPVHVIAEVLAGCHDDRFDDYTKPEAPTDGAA